MILEIIVKSLLKVVFHAESKHYNGFCQYSFFFVNNMFLMETSSIAKQKDQYEEEF